MRLIAPKIAGAASRTKATRARVLGTRALRDLPLMSNLVVLRRSNCLLRATNGRPGSQIFHFPRPEGDNETHAD
jgi:hypothetical protein